MEGRAQDFREACSPHPHHHEDPEGSHCQHRDLPHRIDASEVDEDDVHDVVALRFRVTVVGHERADATVEREGKRRESDRRYQSTHPDGDDGIPSTRPHRLVPFNVGHVNQDDHEQNEGQRFDGKLRHRQVGRPEEQVEQRDTVSADAEGEDRHESVVGPDGGKGGEHDQAGKRGLVVADLSDRRRPGDV